MKQFRTTYSTARDTCVNGMVSCGLSATTQSRCGTCWVTGTLTRCSSYKSEPRVDSRTPMVISRCFWLRLMFFLPTLPFSLPVMQRWRPHHQDTPTAPSPLTLCSHPPSLFLCPEAPHMRAIAASTTRHTHWLRGGPDSLFSFWCMPPWRQAHMKSDP